MKTGSMTSPHERCAELTEMICLMCSSCEQQRVDDDSLVLRLMESGRSHLACLPARGPSPPGL